MKIKKLNKGIFGKSKNMAVQNMTGAAGAAAGTGPIGWIIGGAAIGLALITKVIVKGGCRCRCQCDQHMAAAQGYGNNAITLAI